MLANLLYLKKALKIEGIKIYFNWIVKLLRREKIKREE